MNNIIETILVGLLLLGATMGFIFLYIWVSSKQQRQNEELINLLDHNPNVTLADLLSASTALKPRPVGAIESAFAEYVGVESTLSSMTKVIDGPDYHRRLESFLLLYFSDPNLPGLHEVIKLLRTIEEAKAKTVGDNEAPILAKLRVAVELPVKDLKPLLVF